MLKSVFASTAYDSIIIEKAPVVKATPLLVVDQPAFVMERKILYSDLETNVLRRLYHKVAGLPWLDTPAFPNFTTAIQQSIDSESGWCHQFLQSKAETIAKANGSNFTDAFKSTYLRITLDEPDGRSPGSARVLEIWPAGHQSAIHHHASANGIIRVLHGEIGVAIFAWLSTGLLEPHTETTCSKGDITWLTPDANQVIDYYFAFNKKREE